MFASRHAAGPTWQLPCFEAPCGSTRTSCLHNPLKAVPDRDRYKKPRAGGSGATSARIRAGSLTPSRAAGGLLDAAACRLLARWHALGTRSISGCFRSNPRLLDRVRVRRPRASAHAARESHRRKGIQAAGRAQRQPVRPRRGASRVRRSRNRVQTDPARRTRSTRPVLPDPAKGRRGPGDSEPPGRIQTDYLPQLRSTGGECSNLKQPRSIPSR
jgi:hypothetical protein